MIFGSFWTLPAWFPYWPCERGFKQLAWYHSARLPDLIKSHQEWINVDQMECRSSSCLAFIRDAFIIFHQRFLGTKAYTHFCSPSAIVPFATLRDIDQPFFPQLGLSNRVDLWVTGNTLWPYAMRAAHGPRWETLPGDVRPFCSFPVLWAGTHGSPLVVNVSGTLCSWCCFILGSLCATLVFQAYQAGRHVFLTFIDCFWCLEVCWRAWTWVSGSLYRAKSSFHMVVLPVCRSLAAARDWQTPRFDEMLMSKTEKTIERHAESPDDICFFGVFFFFWGGGKQQQHQILGPWYHWDLGHIGGLCGAMHGSITRFGRNTSPAWPVSRERCTACGGDTLPGGKRWRIGRGC